MPLPSVSCLSDDDAPAPPAPRTGALDKAATARKLKLKPEKLIRTSVDPKLMRRIIAGRCGCKCSCFGPLRASNALYKQWVALRRELRAMTKLEKDRKAG